jgi:hypothetical protein
MSGRRRHPRYVMSNCEATLHVFSEVTVQQGESDLIAIAGEARIRGEVLAIELMNGTLVRTPVRVADSRPIVKNGSIWHELRLMRLEQDAGSTTTGDEFR